MAVRLAPLWVLLVAVIALAIAPVGYVGGGADDVNYLTATRCWVAAGHPCLPHTHWATRWPAIAPMAVFTGVLGESRLTVGLGPLCAWAAAIALMAALGRAWFDRATGYVAAALLAAAPVVTQAALQPGTDTTELALQLAALLLATLAYRRQSVAFSLAAGAVAAIALEARDTSILFCGVSALFWLCLDRHRRIVLLWALAGFAAAVGVELAVYAATTGDPFYRYRLALAHVTVPSAELAANVDTSRSPLFNPDYIAGWKREAGVALWWPIDPWLNLVFSPRIGISLFGAGLVIAAGWKTLSSDWKKIVIRMIGLALLLSAGLIYALAIDPKPRMFFVLVSAACLSAAAVVVSSWRAGRGLVPGCAAALIILGGMDVLSMIANTHDFERHAAQWIAADQGQVEIDPRTLTTLTLLPEARSLPLAGSGRPFRIQATNDGCGSFGAPVVAKVGDSGTGELCLLRLGPGNVVASRRSLKESREADRSSPS